MQSRPIMTTSLGVLAFLLCSCSENDHQAGQSQSADVGNATLPPEISPTAAPGVAFNYAYEFSLPDDRIATAQEAHASACENLGLARCRITGMSFSVDQNEQVTAELDLKLDPQIARQFGKSAQQTVVSQDGKLIRLEIGSSDEGQAITQATQQKSNTTTQLTQLQQELARTKNANARANLLSQIQSLQQQASDQSQTIAASQAALASTPMAIHYYGRGGVPGFRGNPLREAWQTLVTTVVVLVGVLLQVLAVLAPLAVLAVLAIIIWRSRGGRVVRRWIRGKQEKAAD